MTDPSLMPPLLPVGASRRLQLLYRRFVQASVTADETIAKYDESKERLLAGKSRAEQVAAKRNDYELEYLAGKASFHGALASRLALTILVELQIGQING